MVDEKHLKNEINAVLESFGFEVKAGEIPIIGKSGAKHKFDAVAVYPVRYFRRKVLIECKAYDVLRKVGLDDVRNFYSKLMDLRRKDYDRECDKAILITTSELSEDAKKFAQNKKIEFYENYPYSKARLINSLRNYIIEEIIGSIEWEIRALRTVLDVDFFKILPEIFLDILSEKIEDDIDGVASWLKSHGYEEFIEFFLAVNKFIIQKSRTSWLNFTWALTFISKISRERLNYWKNKIEKILKRELDLEVEWEFKKLREVLITE